MVALRVIGCPFPLENAYSTTIPFFSQSPPRGRLRVEILYEPCSIIVAAVDADNDMEILLTKAYCCGACLFADRRGCALNGAPGLADCRRDLAASAVCYSGARPHRDFRV